MAAVPALTRFNSPLTAVFGAGGQTLQADETSKLERSLETLFPDLLVHGTHNTLLSMTTSLSTASSRTHQYFSRVSQILAFERMMRSFIRMTAAMSPFPINPGAANYWTNMFMPQAQTPSPWAFATPQAKPATAMPFFANPFQSQPQASADPAMTFLANAFQAQPAASAQKSAWPDYSELMIVPMALMMAAPSMDQMWGTGRA
jgi:hypothetical protein